jgi:hypothetical protein
MGTHITTGGRPFARSLQLLQSTLLIIFTDTQYSYSHSVFLVARRAGIGKKMPMTYHNEHRAILHGT